jgi:hypothetical protein
MGAQLPFRQKANFGRLVVHITDPSKLLERICAVWKPDERRSSSSPDEIWPVLYNKDVRVDTASDALYSECLIYAQKPPAYAMDREYRYVLKCQSGTKKEEFLTLDVGTCADICSLILI